jgi:hypothetical protein
VIREEGGEDWWSDDELDMGDVLSDAFDEDQPVRIRQSKQPASLANMHVLAHKQKY